MNTFELIDPTTGNKVALTHRIPSARARVDIAKANEVLTPIEKIQAKLKDYAVEVVSKGEQPTDSELVKMAMETGAITAADVERMGSPTSSDVEAETVKAINVFRACVDTRQLTTEWKALLTDDDSMMEQDFVKMQEFAASFRSLLSV